MGSLARKIARGLLRKRRAANIVAELYRRREQGLWIDPSDLSTLYQDTVGSVPVTAPGQTVALALDKSGRGGRVIQPTALARPTLGRHPAGGRRNLLIGSEGQRGWTAVGSSPPAVSAATHLGKACWGITFPAGLANAGWTVSRAVYPSTTYPFPGAYSWRYKVATNRPLLPGETFVVMLNGSFATAGVNFTSADNLTQWADRSVPNIVYAATLNAGLYPAVTNVTTLGEPLTVYITDMQTEAGSVSTPYQRVATDWDVTEDGKRDCWYLGFDGVDDFMVTAEPLALSSTNKLTILAGLRADQLTGTSCWVELSELSNFTPGCFFVSAPVVSTGTQYGSTLVAKGSTGAGPVLNFAGFMSAPSVFTGRIDTSANLRSRINGIETLTAFTQGGPFSGVHKLYIGARAGTSFFSRGRLYQLVIRGAETPDMQVLPVESLIADKMGLAAPVITVASGSGYAGSVLSADKTPGQWFANGVAIPDATGQQLGVTFDLEDADITYKWMGISSLPFRMWTPARAGITSVFDIRRVAAGVTEWTSKDGLIRYMQPNESIRPVYEATGLGDAPGFFHDWNRQWIINGLLPAPEARTFIGCMAFLGSDPYNSANVIARSVAGAWTIRKTYLSGGKRQIAIAKGWDSEWQGSSWVIEDAAVYLVSTKTKRPSGEFSFRLNGVAAGSGGSAVSAFAGGGEDGVYTIGGYLRLGSHAYVDRFISVEDEINFEGWCAWTSGQVSRLPADHPRKSAPLRVS